MPRRLPVKSGQDFGDLARPGMPAASVASAKASWGQSPYLHAHRRAPGPVHGPVHVAAHGDPSLERAALESLGVEGSVAVSTSSASRLRGISRAWDNYWSMDVLEQVEELTKDVARRDEQIEFLMQVG